jgi:hypothetical protein
MLPKLKNPISFGSPSNWDVGDNVPTRMVNKRANNTRPINSPKVVFVDRIFNSSARS